MRIKNVIARKCHDEPLFAEATKLDLLSLRLQVLHPEITSPFMFSDTENKFIVIGCDHMALITDDINSRYSSGCIATCSSQETVIKYNGSCSGISCCQTSIPKGVTFLQMDVFSISANHSTVTKFNPCGHAFLGELSKFTFNVADLSDPTFMNRTRDKVPIVLEWVVGNDEYCYQAQQKLASYACQQNTSCIDFDIGSRKGYRCGCIKGYQGNPYLSPGCTDIDECAGSNNPCSDNCANTPGSFICSCPEGHNGDGLKTGRGCLKDNSQSVMTFSIGISFGTLFLLILVSWIYFTKRKRKLMKIREKLFDQNGGLLLKQQLSPTESSKTFSADELKIATNNYSEDRVLGKGGFGTVYKGTLKDGLEVAIKKPKVGDQDKSQMEEFINEVVILMQTNHKNVVKLLGCCLETKVPLLVYEYISNGTLLAHIKKEGTSWLNWENCIRIATETVDGLAYLHSAALTPIIHRDVKSANILLDNSYTAKIADFGASRLSPIDETLAATDHLLGTFGYIDPESMHTGRLTDKSDVYSFGVVLAELLTKEKVLSPERNPEEVGLAKYFVSSMKQHRLLEILDPRLVEEASQEQLLSVGKLVLKCLDFNSENRPTMREVALELDGLKKQINHPWDKTDEQTYEETTSLVGQQDLYPASSTSYGDSSITSTVEYYGQHSVRSANDSI